MSLSINSVKDLFKNFGSLIKKQDSVLGIDIGSAFVKIVQLRKEKERAVLETYGEVATGPYANLQVGQAAKLSDEKMAELLRDLLKEANAKAKTSSVAIPLKSSLVNVISLPISAEKNISDIIRLEARRYIPVSISEVVLDWWVIPEDVGRGAPKEKGKREFSDILLVAIHKNVIDAYRNIISKAGLTAKMYELESFSMMRACAGRDNSPVVILDFGASTTKLVVADYGIMRVSHSINQGSQDLTLALSHSLNIDFGRAEEMKREIGLSDLPEHAETVSVFEPILEYIFSEANSLTKDFERKNRRSVRKVIITGGGSLLKGLADFAVKRFGIEVEIANPFARVEHPAFLSGILREAGAGFSTAMGLALRNL